MPNMTLEEYEADRLKLQKVVAEEMKNVKDKYKVSLFAEEYSPGDSQDIINTRKECDECKDTYRKNIGTLKETFSKSYHDTINDSNKNKQESEKHKQESEKYRKESEKHKQELDNLKQKDKGKIIKEINMAGEDISDVRAELAGLKANIKNKEKSEYTDFLKGITQKVEGLTQKVDGACTEIGGCRKDITALGSRFDKETTFMKEKSEKENKETCVGFDCVKNSLKELKVDTGKLDKLDLGKLGKLDKLDYLDLHDCPFCEKKVVPIFPSPADFCPGCGKPLKGLWSTDEK